MTTPLDTARWPLRTERLTVRRATTDDLDAIWSYRRLPAANEWMTSAFGDREAFDARFGSAESLGMTLVVMLDGRVIGDLMVKVFDAWAQAEVAEEAVGVQAELGWCLDERHRGHGYAREAVAEVIRMCFTDLGLRRVTADCFAANVASWRLMEHLGMRREIHTVRESLHRSKGWLDGLGYALLAEEWSAPAQPSAPA